METEEFEPGITTDASTEAAFKRCHFDRDSIGMSPRWFEFHKVC